MNAKQRMAYHAREYRRLKSLLVGDAANIPHLEKMTRNYENHAKQLWDSFAKTYKAKMKLRDDAFDLGNQVYKEIQSAPDEKTKQALISIYKGLRAAQDLAARVG